VDKQYYSASLGVLQFFLFFAVIAVRLCRDICGKRRNVLLNETKIVLWQENDWKVGFPEYESDSSKWYDNNDDPYYIIPTRNDFTAIHLIPKNVLVTWHFAVRMFATVIQKEH